MADAATPLRNHLQKPVERFLKKIGSQIAAFYKRTAPMSISRTGKARQSCPVTHSIQPTDKPALLGGTPAIDALPDRSWPWRDEATAAALTELYFSARWSWNGQWEKRAAGLLAQVHTARHAMLLVNGTVTLEAALSALGVGPNDEVIVPSLTWLATAMAVLYVGATPVFVDVEPDTLCLDPSLTAQAITPRTKAIIPVHLYGSMTDMDAIMALANERGLKVVEDCAHGHGGLWEGRGLGSIGDAGSFSFQQSKAVSSGEGGAVITNDDALAERLFRFKHIGYSEETMQGSASDSPPSDLLCHNYRATEFQALLLCPQLERLAEMTQRRNAGADTLTEHLKAIPGLRVQKRGRKASSGRQSYYGMVLQYDPNEWSGLSLDRLLRALAAEGIRAGKTYGPVHRHELWNIPPDRYRIFGDWRDAQGDNCRVSEEWGTQRAIVLNHAHLDLPQEYLLRIAEGFAKVHKHAASISRATE